MKKKLFAVLITVIMVISSVMVSPINALQTSEQSSETKTYDAETYRISYDYYKSGTEPFLIKCFEDIPDTELNSNWEPLNTLFSPDIFEDNVIIAVTTVEPSGSITYSNPSVVKKADGSWEIIANRFSPGMQTCDMASHIIYAVVPKSDWNGGNISVSIYNIAFPISVYSYYMPPVEQWIVKSTQPIYNYIDSNPEDITVLDANGNSTTYKVTDDTSVLTIRCPDNTTLKELYGLFELNTEKYNFVMDYAVGLTDGTEYFTEKRLAFAVDENDNIIAIIRATSRILFPTPTPDHPKFLDGMAQEMKGMDDNGVIWDVCVKLATNSVEEFKSKGYSDYIKDRDSNINKTVLQISGVTKAQIYEIAELDYVMQIGRYIPMLWEDPVPAEDKLTISLNNLDCKPGETVKLQVKIDTDVVQGYVGGNFTFDESVFTCLTESGYDQPVVISYNNIAGYASILLNWGWDDTNYVVPPSITFDIEFKIADNAKPGNYAFKWESIEAFYVNAESSDGSIEIKSDNNAYNSITRPYKVADLICIVKYMNGQLPYNDLPLNPDINGDGEVNVIDSALLRRKLIYS